jgi:N-methylhydantoinase B
MNETLTTAPAGAPEIDQVSLQVFQQRLIGIVREMRAMMIHSAFSAAICELHDLSCAILSRDGDLVVQSEDNPQHIFPLLWSAREILTRYGEKITPEDMFLHNDPYEGGTHLNDIALIVPFFHEGRLAFFPVVRAHWEDVGGSTHGSISGESREIFQEGVRIPLIRVKAGSEALEVVQRLLFANMRIPEEREGDFRAMVGTCAVARQRLGEVLAQHGLEPTMARVTALLNQEERRMRVRLTNLTSGSYVYEGYLDPRPDLGTTLRIRVKVSAREGNIEVDFTGSSPQIQGPHNIGPSGTPTGVFMMLKALVDPSGPVNSGSFRPIRVKAPEGSFLNATYPAAVGAMGDVRRSLEGVLMAAIAPLLPERVTGDTKGTANQFLVSGRNSSNGRMFLLYEAPPGGTGGFNGGDGNHTLRTFAEGDFTAIQPVEAVEQKFPLRIEATRLRMGSCGDGRYRGGLGLTRMVRLLSENGRLSIVSDKNVVPPAGFFGGTAGWPNRSYIVRNGRAETPWPIPGKISSFPLKRDDLVVFETSGGGGYGDPLERSPDQVLADLCLGYINTTRARDVYGVIVGQDGRLDEAGTRRRRDELEAARIVLSVESGPVPDNPHHVPSCVLHPDTAARLGIAEHDIFELLPIERVVVPWRVVALLNDAIGGDRLRLAEALRSLYDIADGQDLLVRPLPRVPDPWEVA